MDQVTEKIREIIAEQAMLDISEVTLDASPTDLGVESLELVEIVFALEESFDISIPFNANDPAASDFDVTSVSSVVDAVKKLISEKD